MKLSFDNRLLIGFSVSIILVIFIGLISYQSINTLQSNSERVEHTYQVINSIISIEKDVIKSESASRGYTIGHNDSFLVPFYNSLDELAKHQDTFQTLTSDNNKQQRNIELLRKQIAEKTAFVRANVEGVKSGRFMATDMAARVLSGKELMEAITANLSAMKSEENRLLHIRNNNVASSTIRTTVIITIGTLLILAIVILLILNIRNAFATNKKSKAELQDNLTKLENLSLDNKRRNWLLSGTSELNDTLRGEIPLAELLQSIVTYITTHINGQIGAIFLANERQTNLKLFASYAYPDRKNANNTVEFGEGLVGQAALEKKTIVFSNIPSDYVKISSGLGGSVPNGLLVAPLIFVNKVIGVIEIGSTQKFTDLEIEFINLVSENVAIAITSAQSRIKMQELFEQTQQQSEELESQQEELRQTNEELVKQTLLLQTSEEELRVQQEELLQANAELEDKGRKMNQQNEVIKMKNDDLEEARKNIQAKAEGLELTSKYKSEFLANMSHELRTPLNSVLILANILSQNKEKNLTDKQVEYANVINRSGNDLLSLINDILDLSKIESGKAAVNIAAMDIQDFVHNTQTLFSELANQKNIDYKVTCDADVPATIVTDRSRVEQVIKNLLSNAFKFTDKGKSVSLSISRATNPNKFKSEKLRNEKNVIAFKVSDTGIGVSEDKIQLIFEAFQQADASTSRKYGGTGLGLSISKEIAHMLGGEITLESKPGEGSTFTIYLPENYEARDENSTEEPIVKAETRAEQKNAIKEEESLPLTGPKNEGKTMLIIEDDPDFNKILQNYATERGFKIITAFAGDKGLEAAQKQLPDAILLDIQLPGMDGWSVLKRLKESSMTRHIPVHIMSGTNTPAKGFEMGAVNYLIKPIQQDLLAKVFDQITNAIDKRIKHVLIVEDNVDQNKSIKALIDKENIISKSAFTAEEALEMVNKDHFDCVILDIGLPKVTGFELLEKMSAKLKPLNTPIIIYTGKDISPKEEAELKKYTNTVILKTAMSYERLMNEVTLFLNKVNEEPESQPELNKVIPKEITTNNKILKGKKVIIVDDDMRNIYALTSILESESMNIITAGDGKEALQRLTENPDSDIILMDMMMPEMDGYEAMGHIRKMAKFKDLPILALTAKAMKGDKEKCIVAGATDYVSKPIDIDKLLSLMKVWLYK